LAQRSGRLIRQGNKNPEVYVYRYVTEKTFDAYSYQLIESKQKFISQIMSGRSPVRSAEDVDETALPYAEIKALATGNPLIIEKCELEMQVGKLQLLKSSFRNERFALEDKVLSGFPRSIAYYEERIPLLEADISLAAQSVSASTEHFSPMVVEGRTFATPIDAGFAILEACKAYAGEQPLAIGGYRGFTLELSFDQWSKAFFLHICGRARLKIDLGSDARGNITRIDNALSDLPKQLAETRTKLADHRQQLAAAKTELERPFPKEAELAEKSARLAEVNAALNLDRREAEDIDDVPDEGDAAAAGRGAKKKSGAAQPGGIFIAKELTKCPISPRRRWRGRSRLTV
jgi:hypothetical protein